MTKSKFSDLTTRQRRKAFAEEFQSALDRANTNASSLAREMELSYHRVHHWLSGRSMPSYQTVALIADHLGDDHLERIGISLNQRTCVNCKTQYLQQSPQGRSFLCSKTCRQENERVRSKGGVSFVKNAKIKNANPYKDAVDRFCASCEPGGMCRNGGCPLRPVSPLPLFHASQGMYASGGKRAVKSK